MTSLALVARAPAEVARATIAHHSKSFALASRLLGTRLRDQTSVVYTWCRRADDAIDDGTHDGAAVLERLCRELDEAYAGTARDPVLAAFGNTLRERRIPNHYPEELLAGMAMDVRGMTYQTVDELIGYAWRVAGVVGLMMTHVFGVTDESALVHAAHLGIAMQLTNVCRDVAEDWARGRLYLPDELLAAHGAAALADELNGPLPRSARIPIAGAVAELLALADRYYRSGDRGVSALHWRAALAVRSASRIYAAIGDRIARTGHDVTAGRAVVSPAMKLAHALVAASTVTIGAPVRIARALGGRATRVPHRTLELADVPRL